jgi:AraC-like DNA-binding protein
MTDQLIPDDIKRFILLSIPSVPYLEALLLMHAAPATAWTASHIAQRLYMSEKTAADLLAALLSSGFASADGDTAASHRYCPQSPQQSQLVDQLAIIYGKNLIAVSNMIHSTTHRKAQQFASAFIIRKEP